METPGYVLLSADHHKMVLPKMYGFFLHQLFVDVTIQCGDARIKAHSVVLASNSKYFEEKIQKLTNDIRVLTVPVNADILVSLIQFMYLGRTVIEARDADGIKAAAHLLEIAALDGIEFEAVTEEHPIINNEDDFISMVQRLDMDDSKDDLDDGQFVLVDIPSEKPRRGISRRGRPPSGNTPRGCYRRKQNVGMSEEDFAAQVIASQMASPSKAADQELIHEGTPSATGEDHSEYLLKDDCDNIYMLPDFNNLLGYPFLSDESTEDAPDDEETDSADEVPDTRRVFDGVLEL